MSQIWFGGIGAGGGAFGAGEAYPELSHSVRAQFCPIPHSPLPECESSGYASPAPKAPPP